MNWLNKLERKFGKYYIPNLIFYITVGSAFCYLLSFILGNSFLQYFILNPVKIMQGQVWRLITFIFVTPSTSILYIITISFYYFIGRDLQAIWGDFKFNVYYFTNVLITIILSIVGYFIARYSGAVIYASFASASTLMNLSLLFAIAKICPDNEVLLYFIIPLKMKYLGYFNWALIAFELVEGIIEKDIFTIIYAIVPIISYLLFLGKNNYNERKMKTKSVIRMKDYKKKVNSNKKKYTHKCEVCGITNLDDEDMEFRYCSKCVGKHCYCEKHILNHEHKKS